MKIDLRFTLFIIVFHLIYFAMHFYIFTRIAGLLSINQGFLFYLIIIITTLSFTFSMILERKVTNSLTRYIYGVAASWFGFISILLTTLLIFEIINAIQRLPSFEAGISIVCFASLISIYAIINGRFVRTKKIEIKINGLKNGINSVQITDLHLGTIHDSAFLEKVVKRVNNLNPEVVFLTGDLVDGSAPLHKGMINPINKIKAPIFYVIGNHEIYDGLENVLKIVKTTKIIPLRNKLINFKGIQLIGIDYHEEKDAIKKIFEILKNTKYKKKKPSILLYHAPLPLDQLEKAGIDLHLAGHTHGGQVFPFHLFVRMVFRYIKGFHKKGRAQEYISSGTGTWGPPMRLGSQSEITSIKISQ